MSTSNGASGESALDGPGHTAMAASTVPAPDPALDLTSCDREPIHIPGSIQGHGFLLALDPVQLVVREASRNAGEYLGRPLSGLFGRTLPELLGEQGRTLLRELDPDTLSSASRLLPLLEIGQGVFDAVAHRVVEGGGNQERIILEGEERREPVDMEALAARLYNFVAANRGRRTVLEVMQAAVAELRALTGCDRVVLYSFDPEGHGLVRAEERGEQFASYLGLQFPASDVPKQARRMYELTRVRIIPDVDYEPSPLLSADGRPASLDLSLSVLRSVSPVHRAYMRNMGTVCSMSVSILIEGRLWGLVSCHHHEPRYVPLPMRSACDFILQVVSAQIEAEQGREHLQRIVQLRQIQTRLLAAMSSSENWMDGLLANPDVLMELMHADGVALVTGRTSHLFGVTPTSEQVLGLADWLRAREDSAVFVSRRMEEDYEPAKQFAAVGSGMVAVSLSRFYSTHLLWFRREQVATVRWAGDPHKPAEPAGQRSPATAVTVNPRHSFEEWLQTVRGQSLAWTSEEQAAAAELRNAVLEIVLKRAEELAALAVGLKVANEELEAFSYSVSHDLRAPFRHISGFSEMLLEEEGARMSVKGRRYLDTIMGSARFAGQLVDSLLDFSRIARMKIEMAPVDMGSLTREEWRAVLAEEGQGRDIRFVEGELSRAVGDVALLRQVMRNLLSNAIKYTGKVEQATVEAGGWLEGREAIFFVRDNGAGFDQKYAGKLFGVFQRLHRNEEFGGTGIGLANVRRIVARHGGRTWAEGEVGKGATFYFSLPAAFGNDGD